LAQEKQLRKWRNGLSVIFTEPAVSTLFEAIQICIRDESVKNKLSKISLHPKDVNSYEAGMFVLAEELTALMLDPEAEEILQRLDALVREGEWSKIWIQDKHFNYTHVSGSTFSFAQK